jgi:hypothetical protein
LPLHTESPRTSFVSNAVGIGGFVILAIIVIWGLTHLFHISTDGWFSGLFQNKATIQVSTPAQATSSEPFVVSWKYAPSTKGNYALLYQCNASTKIAIVESDAQIDVTCGKAFTVSATNKLSLLPTLTGTTSVKLPLSIMFMPSATGTKAEGGTTITIHPRAGAAQVALAPEGISQTSSTQASTTHATAHATSSQTHSTHAEGPADFSVRIVAVGAIDPQTGIFIDRAPTQNDIAAVKFDIGNVGGTATGPWYFSADLPTQNGYAYTSPRQASLAPGAHILNTLRFNQIIPGGTFSVTADPQNQINESTNENNTAAVTIGY